MAASYCCFFWFFASRTFAQGSSSRRIPRVFWGGFNHWEWHGQYPNSVSTRLRASTSGRSYLVKLFTIFTTGGFRPNRKRCHLLFGDSRAFASVAFSLWRNRISVNKFRVGKHRGFGSWPRRACILYLGYRRKAWWHPASWYQFLSGPLTIDAYSGDFRGNTCNPSIILGGSLNHWRRSLCSARQLP